MSQCSHFLSLKPQKIANMIKKAVFRCTSPEHTDTQFNLCLHCGQSKCNNPQNNKNNSNSNNNNNNNSNGNKNDKNKKQQVNCFTMHMDNNNGKHVLALKLKDCYIYCYRCEVEIEGMIWEMEEKDIGGSKIQKMRQLHDKIRQIAVKNLPNVYKDEKVSKKTNQKKSQSKYQPTLIQKQPQRHTPAPITQIPQLRTFGLSNIGNTCYFNSLLQCLFSIPQIHSFYFQTQLKDDLNRSFYKFLLNSQKTFCPKSLFSTVAQKFKFLKSMDQQDAYELYVLMIDALIQGTVAKGEKIGFREKIENSIGKVFGFFCASRLECLECGKISWNKDFNLGLTVPISKPISKKIEVPQGEQIDAEQIGQPGLSYPSVQVSNNFLDNFFTGQLLTKSNSFKCQKCSEARATKKFYLMYPPQILTINFKKFSNSGKKIDSYISIPPEIDLAPHCLKKGTFTYQLHAGIVHSGSSKGGHYVAYTKRAYNKWYYFSDSNVKPASLNSLRDMNPYVLMYRKKVYQFDNDQIERTEKIEETQNQSYKRRKSDTQQNYYSN